MIPVIYDVWMTKKHSGGDIISYALWFSTEVNTVEMDSEMILIHFGNTFIPQDHKDMFTLTLRGGTPILYARAGSELSPVEIYNLGDTKWNHVAISMPKQSCRLSEVVMYINGKIVKTIGPKHEQDKHIFFNTSGRLSLGGFGLSSLAYDERFPRLSPFLGRIDEFYMWGKSLTPYDVAVSMQKGFNYKTGRKCIKKWGTRQLNLKKCIINCSYDPDCWGFAIRTNNTNDIDKCIHYKKRPRIGAPDQLWTCGKVRH